MGPVDVIFQIAHLSNYFNEQEDTTVLTLTENEDQVQQTLECHLLDELPCKLRGSVDFVIYYLCTMIYTIPTHR